MWSYAFLKGLLSAFLRRDLLERQLFQSPIWVVMNMTQPATPRFRCLRGEELKGGQRASMSTHSPCRDEARQRPCPAARERTSAAYSPPRCRCCRCVAQRQPSLDRSGREVCRLVRFASESLQSAQVETKRTARVSISIVSLRHNSKMLDIGPRSWTCS